MPDFILVKDPRGISVSCSVEQWEQHITQHSEMVDNVDAIIRTIEDPDVIYESHDSNPIMDCREMYVKEVKTASYYPSVKYTKVITSTIGGSSEVVTAYSSKKKENGRMPGKEALYVASEEEPV